MEKKPKKLGTANAVALNEILSDFVLKYQLLSALVILAFGVLHPHAHALYDGATLGAFLAILLVIGLDAGFSLKKSCQLRFPSSCPIPSCCMSFST